MLNKIIISICYPYVDLNMKSMQLFVPWKSDMSATSRSDIDGAGCQ